MPRGVSRLRQAELQTILALNTRTMSALSADVDDYDLSVGACFNVGGDVADRTIKGIAGGTEGRFIELCNTLGYNIFLQNEATTSLAQNRILTGLPNGASYMIPANGAVLLSYNNEVNRWLIMSNFSSYAPEDDANVAALFRNETPRRSGGVMSQGSALQKVAVGLSGYLKGAFKIKTDGDVGAQAMGTIGTNSSITFTLPQSGDCIFAIAGTAFPGVTVVTGCGLGIKIDTGAIQQLCDFDSWNNGSGADAVGDIALFGIWGQTLAAGSHTAAICFRGTNYGLRANATQPAVIVAFYPG